MVNFFLFPFFLLDKVNEHFLALFVDLDIVQ